MKIPPQVEMFSVFHILKLQGIIMSLFLPPLQTDLIQDEEFGDATICEDKSRS